MKDISRALLRNILPTEKCNSLIQIEGAKTKNIRISEMEGSSFNNLIKYQQTVLKDEVKVLSTF